MGGGTLEVVYYVPDCSIAFICRCFKILFSYAILLLALLDTLLYVTVIFVLTEVPGYWYYK